MPTPTPALLFLPSLRAIVTIFHKLRTSTPLFLPSLFGEASHYAYGIVPGAEVEVAVARSWETVGTPPKQVFISPCPLLADVTRLLYRRLGLFRCSLTLLKVSLFRFLQYCLRVCV